MISSEKFYVNALELIMLRCHIGFVRLRLVSLSQPFLGVSSLDLGRSLWCIGPFLFRRLPQRIGKFHQGFQQRPRWCRASVACKVAKSRVFSKRCLIHVEGAVDFDLQGVAAQGGRAIVLGDEAAGIGLVADHAQAVGAQQVFDEAR